jgi:hypothetical protein
MIRRLLVAVGFAASALCVDPVRAVELPTPSPREAVLDEMVARLSATYVDPDAARSIAQKIGERRRYHAYDDVQNPADFAEAVTRDLRSVNGDLHLGLHYVTDAMTPARPASPFGDPREVNYGLGRAEILDGNVGYLEITGFTGGDYQAAVVDALRFLSRSDALIIDLRRNGGGASDMSHFIFSHFLNATPVPTINVYARGSREPNRRMSLADVPGPRRADVPLFLLISQGTGSAAEEFSFVLKNLRRATLVGRRTAGAGHMVAQIPVGQGFVFSASITRVTDPRTGLEWEQVGVQPDIAVDPQEALLAAQVAALKGLSEGSADAAHAKRLNLLREGIEAQLHPVPVDPKMAKIWTGVYEGREVVEREGRLSYIRRAGGLPEPMVFLGQGRFAIGAQRLKFSEASGGAALTVQSPDGQALTLPKSNPPH